MQQRQPNPLNVADLAVESFETATMVPSTITDWGPTPMTMCYYCPEASLQAVCDETIGGIGFETA